MRTEPEGPRSPWAGIIAARMPRGTAQRVRAHRRLRQAGALVVRPGVYALPDSSEGRDALATAAREVARQRGSALPCLVSWLDPADEERLRSRFEAERTRPRERLLRNIAALERAISGERLNAASRRTAQARLVRLRRRLDKAAARPMTAPLVGRAASHHPALGSGASPSLARTWVTRKGVLVDRIASAWLIVRFIDRDASFQFVSPGEPAATGALRFDMADAEFGHEGDRCTFETLVARVGGDDDAALRQLAEIVHDLDIRDGKFGRVEAPGVAQVITGLAAGEPDDAARIAQGLWLFDCLYLSLRAHPAPRLPKGVLR